LDVDTVVGMAVGLLLVGILFPLGLAAIEDYVPTDPTILIVWPLIGVFACLGVAIYYIKRAS
jgi:hypothetical protein